MNTREANDYIDNLIQGKFVPESEFETGALTYLRKTVAEERELKERADFLATELETMKQKLQTLTGRREAYLQILIDAEMKRRMKSQTINRSVLSKEALEANPVIPCDFQKKGEIGNAQEGR